MWNKKFPIIWLKLSISEGRRFFLTLPIPLYVFGELMDCLLDLLTFAYLFLPKGYKDSELNTIQNTNMIHSVIELVYLTRKLFSSLIEGEPYDLVNVAANKVKIIIHVSP